MIRVIHTDLLKYLSDYLPVIRNGHMPKYHAVLCDPPYYLGSIAKRFGSKNAAPAQHGSDGRFQRLSGGFMGATWDGFESPQDYQAWITAWGEMLLEYVYPGAVLMAFGGSRTYHRLVSGLEDAGWEIYDSIMVWTYSSGFPKSHDISKAIDKKFGAERKVIGQSAWKSNNAANQIYGTFNHSNENLPLTSPATIATQLWQGYGTALAPSYEPIVLARAPRKGHTYADCALQFGTSGLNIDGSRIESDEITGWGGNPSRGYSEESRPPEYPREVIGRWAKNTMLVHHPACADKQCHPECHVYIMTQQSAKIGESNARMFYQAKTATWERDAGLNDFPVGNNGTYEGRRDGSERAIPVRANPHPTVKPIQLIESIARLILPPIPDARLLVPFSGSGSEMIGAMLAGWQHVTGIEKTDEYIPIAQARLKWWQRFDSYAMAETHMKQHEDTQLTMFEYMATKQRSLFDLPDTD